MTFARRLCAATMTLVLALFPVALERCRTACVSGGAIAQASTEGHACHDMAGDEDVSRLDPMARACGHGDETRTYESVGLVAGKGRPIAPLAAVQPLPGSVPMPPGATSTGWPPDRSVLPPVALPLDLPLRL